MYIDADDTFESNALPLLRNVIEKNKDLDILKFDYALVERNGSTKNIIEEFDSQDVMSGHDFIKRNSIPWSSWLCAYRRLFFSITFLSKGNAFDSKVSSASIYKI